MKSRNGLPSAEEVKNTNIVDYLLSLGINPAKVSRNNYRYFSPFRDETTPSFKLNRNINRWYDSAKAKAAILLISEYNITNAM